jgi:hypothetical protein
MQHIAFHSSHVSGGYASGRLTIHLWKETLDLNQSLHDELSFEVPADFHAHNDLVAAALMTLVGETYQSVAFNFAISQRCADILASYYALNDVGPVDPSLEPRRPGRFAAFNFSGGLDSTALWWLLKRELGEEIKIVTSDYGGQQAHERRGFEAAERDLTCRTDFRRKGYDRAGRFNAAVPLLFADYLDLHSLASAHTLRQEQSDTESLKEGQAPSFLALERAYQAGGLHELHYVRSVHSRALQKVLVLAAPHLLERALNASGRPGTEKHFTRAHVLRDWFRRLGNDVPAYLQAIPPPTPMPYVRRERNFMHGLLVARLAGVGTARQIAPWLDDVDLSPLDELSLEFLARYNPNFIHLIPASAKHRLLDVFHAYGIYPYTQHDWHEIEVADTLRRQVLAAVSRATGDAAGSAPP